MSRITDEQIETIAAGQTDVTYEGNGPFLVKDHIKYAIKQALDLNDGKEITLPKGKKMKLTPEKKI